MAPSPLSAGEVVEYERAAPSSRPDRTRQGDIVASGRGGHQGKLLDFATQILAEPGGERQTKFIGWERRTGDRPYEPVVIFAGNNTTTAACAAKPPPRPGKPSRPAVERC